MSFVYLDQGKIYISKTTGMFMSVYPDFNGDETKYIVSSTANKQKDKHVLELATKLFAKHINIPEVTPYLERFSVGDNIMLVDTANKRVSVIRITKHDIVPYNQLDFKDNEFGLVYNGIHFKSFIAYSCKRSYYSKVVGEQNIYIDFFRLKDEGLSIIDFMSSCLSSQDHIILFNNNTVTYLTPFLELGTLMKLYEHSMRMKKMPIVVDEGVPKTFFPKNDKENAVVEEARVTCEDFIKERK